MSVLSNTGTELTKSALLAKTTTLRTDTYRTVNEDIYESFSHVGEQDFNDSRRLLYPAGTVVLESDIDAKYAKSAATFVSVVPAVGGTAGGTDVVITGTGFDGATGVTIGGVALTDFDVVSDTQITGTTGAMTAGSKALVITDTSGNVTANAAFTVS